MIINRRKIKVFIKKHRLSFVIIATVIFVAIGIIFYNFFFLSKNNISIPGLKTKPRTKVEAPYTGLLVDPSVASKRPLAVVIENHPDARPQSGYPKADLVYETLAEGGITRTLAIFQSQNANEIGPVRSARLYFIDWLSEFGAVFVHVGGNIDALDEIAAKNIPDINQFAFGDYFWRSTDRYAPHNVYTTTEKLYSALKKDGVLATADLTALSFKKDATIKDRPVSQSVSIDFSSPLFLVTYTYGPKTNMYVRSVGGVIQKDKVTGEPIKVKNVVVQYEPMSYGVTRLGEQKTNIGSIGRGKAFVFQDGKTISVSWEKTSRSARTKLTNSIGEEIKFNPGQTWFEIVPQTATVKY